MKSDKLIIIYQFQCKSILKTKVLILIDLVCKIINKSGSICFNRHIKIMFLDCFS